jgi:transcriptional regulator with XRE-family HTH domain
MPKRDDLRALRKTIGAHLRQERLRCGFTLEELARLSQVSARKLALYENGKGAITLELLGTLAHALNTGLGGFFLAAG